MSCRPLLRPLVLLSCGLLALLVSHPAAAQNRAIMQVSVTVVNTCQFGRVNSCALPGTRIDATAPADKAGTVEAGATQPVRQVVHL